MAETDFIIKGLTVSYSGIFNLKELYKYIKRWLKESGSFQEINEKLYQEEHKQELKTTTIKVDAKKKVDDYTKFIIKVTIKGSDYEDVKADGKSMQKGSLKIELNAEMEKDYQEKWEEAPSRKFFRGLYDRFLIGFRIDKLSKELTDETYDLYNEIKKYLDI